MRFVSITFSSHHSILPALLTSDMTHQHFMMTGSRLYCFYPQLFENHEFRRIRPGPPYNRPSGPIQRFAFGLRHQVAHSTPLSDIPCGSACHIQWMTALPSNNVSGIQSFRWGGMHVACHNTGIPSPDEDRLFENNHMLWRRNLGNCDNQACPNFGSSHSRLHNPRFWTC